MTPGKYAPFLIFKISPVNVVLRRILKLVSPDDFRLKVGWLGCADRLTTYNVRQLQGSYLPTRALPSGGTGRAAGKVCESAAVPVLIISHICDWNDGAVLEEPPG